MRGRTATATAAPGIRDGNLRNVVRAACRRTKNSFHELTHGNTGWIHADGYVPTLLTPDGRTAWWMSDTGVGTVNPNNSANPEGSVAQQRGPPGAHLSSARSSAGRRTSGST